MDEGIHSMVETIKELEAENEKLKFRLSNIMQRSEQLKAFIDEFIESTELDKGNERYLYDKAKSL